MSVVLKKMIGTYTPGICGGFNNALNMGFCTRFKHGVHTGTNLCTHSWKSVAVKCLTGANFINLSPGLLQDQFSNG